MYLRTKLFLYYFSISILIIVVGSVFYLQLRNLIGPLTPENVPKSVTHLANTIHRDNLVNSIKYQQLLAERNLEDYAYTKSILSLQKYYMDNAIVQQSLTQASTYNANQFPKLLAKFNAVTAAETQLIHEIQSNASNQVASEYLNNSNYHALLHDFSAQLKVYFEKPNDYSNEVAVVTVRLAAKNSHRLLQKSLDTTLIIFMDAILVSFLLVIFSSQAIVQPINSLRRNIEMMSANLLTGQVDPKLLRLQSEVGSLARSFADLIKRLNESTVLRDELLAEIQKQKETEARLMETAKHLQESNQDLDQFAYAASHDLRSPLKAIESLATWIEEDCYNILPEKSRENFALIKRRVHRLNALIAGMLEYSRAGRVTADLEIVNLNQLIPEIIDSLSPPPTIRINIISLLPIIETEKTKIHQVFLNLISNAIKYNDKLSGYIDIGYKMIGDYHQFYVEDNGLGIDPQYSDKIFEIFQTLQSRDKIESSGIGLAIVKKIVESKGGKIWVTSKPGEGATFYFTWPIR